MHALHEAHRVLKPDGLLIDLRPAAVHRRIGITRAGRYRQLGLMREEFDDDFAANRAVAHVVQQGLFKTEWRTQFDCRRRMDTFAEFRVWMEELITLGKLPSHAELIQKVERAFKASHGKREIVVRGPLRLRVLRKLDL